MAQEGQAQRHASFLRQNGGNFTSWQMRLHLWKEQVRTTSKQTINKYFFKIWSCLIATIAFFMSPILNFKLKQPIARN